MHFRDIIISNIIRFDDDNQEWMFAQNYRCNCMIHICGNWNKSSDIENVIANLISHETLDNLVWNKHKANIHTILNSTGKMCKASNYINPSGILYRSKARKALGLSKTERL